MVQFYFLAILANIIGGLALSSSFVEKRLTGLSGLTEYFGSKPGLRVTIGVVAVVTGVLKLLSATKGDVPVVGDLLPSLTGIAVGVALLYERYKEKTTLPPESQAQTAAMLDRIILTNRSILGSWSILIGIVHFFLPGVLFL